MDYEIGHINISIPSDETREVDTKTTSAEREPAADDKAVVDWHTDAYPFVCIVMLSDCKKMTGGETAIRKGDGSIMTVRAPEMGHAIILQGRYIEHQALKAFGGSERITMVTSFRPKSPFVRNDTVLTTVRPVSDLSELYGGYTEAQLEILEERIRAQRLALKARKVSGKRFDTVKVKEALREVRDIINATLTQLVDEDQVVPGVTETSHRLTKDV